jgi:hypothetical protein
MSVLILALCPAARAAETATPGWTTVALPLDRTSLANALGLDEGLPRTVLLAEALRRLHEADIHAEPLRATLLSAIAAATDNHAPTAAVPLPLTVPIWCALLAGPCDQSTIAARILGDPAAGLLYLGLSAADEETRRYIATRPDLLAWLKARRPGTFAAFAAGLHVVGGRMAAPGGQIAEPQWEALVGEPLGNPDAFLRKLLTVERGRYAYLFDTLSHLDEAHQRFALVMEEGAALIALGRLFADIEPAWDVESRPFVRPFFDGATLLAHLRLDADGRLSGPRSTELWSRVFDADGGDVDEEDQAALLDGPAIDAAWLVRSVESSNLRIRASRLLALLFGQRLGTRVTQENAADAVTVLRAAIRMPALVLTLERMGVRDLRLTASLVRIARALTSRGDRQERDRSLIVWQGALAIVDRLAFVGRIDSGKATVLLTELANAAGDDQQRTGPAVAEWIRSSLLPSLSPNDAPTGSMSVSDPEGALVETLGGPAPRTSETLAWEDAVYRVDPAHAERVRLESILSRMGGCTLTQALEATAIANALRQARTDGAKDATARRLTDLVVSLEGDPAAGGELEVLGRGAVAGLDNAAQELAGTPGGGAARRLAAAIEDAGTTVLAIALRRLAYAAALGSPESQAMLAGDVAARHELGAERAGMPAGPLPQWAIPTEEAASSRGWHVRGSLLALDVALGRLWLRRVLGEMPFHEPTLNESERRVLVAGLVLLPRAALADGDRAAILSAMARGRSRVRDGASDARSRAALCRDAGFCGWRNEVLAWAAPEEPEALLSTISRTELVWLGWSADTAPPDAWGTVTVGVDGVLAPRFQPPLPVEVVSGRGPLAQALGRFADLKLRLAELLGALGVPSTLMPDVLASALQDYLDDVRPAYPEDWPAMLHRVEEITRGRAEDYVAALTAVGGPLVPDGASAGDDR